MADTPEGPIQITPATAKRTGQQFRDMAISMGLVGAGVILFVFVAWRPQVDPIRPVDPAPTISLVAEAAPFTVLAPEGLPWTATSVRYTPATAIAAAAAGEPDDELAWHLGVLTPDEKYVGLEQGSRLDVGDFLFGALPVRDGIFSSAGLDWQRYDGAENGYRALVAEVPAGTGKGAVESTIVVNGSASWPQLEEFVQALEPVPADASPSGTAG